MLNKKINIEIEPSSHFLHSIQVISEAVMKEAGFGSIDTDSKTYNFVLAIDEIITNIFKHGLKLCDKPDFKISIKYIITPQKITVEIQDGAPKYVPPSDYDETTVLDNFSGMGLHFVRTLMDEYIYTYDEKLKINNVLLSLNIK